MPTHEQQLGDPSAGAVGAAVPGEATAAPEPARRQPSQSIGAPFPARCAQSHLPPTAPAASQVEVYEGALAFIDISGFSRLSELLSERHGAEGAELLQTYINRYFRSLIEAALASPPTALQWVVSPRRPTAPRRSWSLTAATS